MSQQKRLTRAQKVTIGKIRTNWSKCHNLPMIDMAELLSRKLIETQGTGDDIQFRLTPKKADPNE